MSDALIIGIAALVLLVVAVALGLWSLYRIKGGRYETYDDHTAQVHGEA